MKVIRKIRLLRITSAIMLICVVPMLMWCIDLIYITINDNDYSALGCFVAAIVYAFSIITALTGLILAGKPHRYIWCRIPAYMQLTAGVALIFLLHVYTILTLPPLFILTVLYLSFTGWSNKRYTEQQKKETLPAAEPSNPNV